MTRTLLVALAVLTVSASAASAAHHTHHRHAMNAYAAAPESPPPPMGWMGGASSNDHAMYLRNLHDSGYNPSKDRDANGNVAAQ